MGGTFSTGRSRGLVSKVKMLAEIDRLGIHATKQDLEAAKKAFPVYGTTPEVKKKIEANLENWRFTANVMLLNQRVDEILSEHDERFKNGLKELQRTTMLNTPDSQYLLQRRDQFWKDPKLNGLQVYFDGEEIIKAAKTCGS